VPPLETGAPLQVPLIKIRATGLAKRAGVVLFGLVLAAIIMIIIIIVVNSRSSEEGAETQGATNTPAPNPPAPNRITVTQPCADFNDFTAAAAPLDAACCSVDGSACPMGIPTTCSPGCAVALLPVQVDPTGREVIILHVALLYKFISLS
jgi:hypothetical protein